MIEVAQAEIVNNIPPNTHHASLISSPSGDGSETFHTTREATAPRLQLRPNDSMTPTNVIRSKCSISAHSKDMPSVVRQSPFYYLFMYTRLGQHHHDFGSQFGSDALSVKIVFQSTAQTITRNLPTLHETTQHFAPGLQQRMAYYNLHKALQALPSMLNYIITEAICENLARQRWNGDPRTLPL